MRSRLRVLHGTQRIPAVANTLEGKGATPLGVANGVTVNSPAAQETTYVVPASAPATLFYQCSIHNAMSGTLEIVDETVPALGPVAVIGLAALVLAAGYIMRRRRDRRGV